MVTFTAADGSSDARVTPDLAVYVPAGQSPTPFLPEGKFTAVWEGWVSVDLRGNYNFQAELNGAVSLELNGEAVLGFAGTNAASEPGRNVRLNKGANVLRAVFTSATRGDSFLRLEWKSRDSFFQPIPGTALSHLETPELAQAAQRRLGRDLFLEHRCLHCHTGPQPDAIVPELMMDAPAFDGIGARRHFDWLARWIADPKALRPGALMPKLPHGANAAEDARAMAAYLASLKSDALPGRNPPPERAAAGEELFDSLLCAACHIQPGSSETDPAKVSLTQVREKFTPGALEAFLEKPEAHYAWIRMPRFRLSDAERADLAAFLIATSQAPQHDEAPDPGLFSRGKTLVQTIGCLNCHSHTLPNEFSAPPLSALAGLDRGCLAQTASSPAAQFAFTESERKALQAFLAPDRTAATRHDPIEFTARHTRHLNCLGCHSNPQGFPRFEILGGKLKPEWTQAFLAGEIHDKPRPWLEAQMPAFPKFAADLARGLAMQHGLPPRTPTEPPIDRELAVIGQTLISLPPHGFSCVTCHAMGTYGAPDVFDAPGINLAISTARLQPSYFHRWMLNPHLIEPLTKMPVYFDEGRSPLADICDGNADRQIEAIWNYLRLGGQAPPPLAPE